MEVVHDGTGYVNDEEAQEVIVLEEAWQPVVVSGRRWSITPGAEYNYSMCHRS
jgi:hypothetical protein